MEVRVLNNNNIHQQDQQVRKPSHHHLEGGPGAIAIHTIEHTATNVLDTKKNQVQVPSVNQHEVTNTLQNQITMPNISVTMIKMIKMKNKIWAGDAAAYRQLFNFLIKCQSLDHLPSGMNPLNSPGIIWLIWVQDQGTSSLAGLMKQNCLENLVDKMKQPGLIDLTNFKED